MEAEQISVTEKQKNEDGSITYEISMPKEQFTKVSKVLAKEGYTIKSYLIEFLNQLVKEKQTDQFISGLMKHLLNQMLKLT